jgi:hypothetical protein
MLNRGALPRGDAGIPEFRGGIPEIRKPAAAPPRKVGNFGRDRPHVGV